ncbi:MAG: DUF3307 domain-containing protein [Paludibacter sp.]|nr:DUF3307 domain-containing protein [Paludibacter sp.]MDD4197984.1 DUF3307 domain-containing protein [Paludibacter sp.]MDD4427617.1 DUF3307 domain-containing protein [Paludibacter sp.]
MNPMNFDLLLRILVAHFIADFVLQSTTMAKKKDKYGVKSTYFWFHIGIHVLILALILWNYHLWPVLLGISVGHFLIDAIKTRIARTSTYVFIVDQTLHVVIIIAVWLVYTQQQALLVEKISELVSNQKIWGIILAYTLVTIPTGVFIGKVTGKWAKELEKHPDAKKKSGLNSAGKWIGILERILIITFIIANEFGAIGFLLAAKSVFRFGDLNNDSEHKKTEYIIVGTLLSFVFAIGIGLMYKVIYM